MNTWSTKWLTVSTVSTTSLRLFVLKTSRQTKAVSDQTSFIGMRTKISSETEELVDRKVGLAVWRVMLPGSASRRRRDPFIGWGYRNCHSWRAREPVQEWLHRVRDEKLGQRDRALPEAWLLSRCDWSQKGPRDCDSYDLAPSELKSFELLDLVTELFHVTKLSASTHAHALPP